MRKLFVVLVLHSVFLLLSSSVLTCLYFAEDSYIVPVYQERRRRIEIRPVVGYRRISREELTALIKRISPEFGIPWWVVAGMAEVETGLRSRVVGCWVKKENVDPVRKIFPGALVLEAGGRLARISVEVPDSISLSHLLEFCEDYDLGLLQINSWWVRESGFSPEEVMIPERNIVLALCILTENLERFGGNLSRALEAYHRGPAGVRRTGGLRYARRVLKRARRWRASS